MQRRNAPRKETLITVVEFQQNAGSFFDGKGHWYSVRRLSNRYAVVRVELDPTTHRHVPVATLSTHGSPAEARTAACEEEARSATSEQEF